MKVRHGFVSNSSSSSFIAIIEENEFNRCLDEADEYTTAVMNKISTSTHKFLGKDIIIMNINDGYGDSTFDYLDIDVEAPIVDKNHEAYAYVDVGEDDDGENRPLTPEYVFNKFINGISEEFCISYSIET